MVTGLLEEVEKIFAGNILEEKEEVGLGLECAIKSDDIWVSGECLMDGGLWMSERIRNRI